jgi:hypothetical protein
MMKNYSQKNSTSRITGKKILLAQIILIICVLILIAAKSLGS